MSTYLRTIEVSEKTGIPAATLRWWRHRNEGPPSFKLGKRTVVYPAIDLELWIAQQRNAASSLKGDLA